MSIVIRNSSVEGPATDEQDKPVAVTVCEVWLRDGLQGWPDVVPTSGKLAVLDLVLRSGVREIDVTSLVPPTTSVQFGDAREMLAAFDGVPGVRTRVLAVNARSVSTAAAMKADGARIDTCGFPISASESHNLANLRRDHAAHKAAMEQMIAGCHDAGIEPLMAVATAFGCPLEGVVPEEKVIELAGWAHDRGVRRIMLGDTTGMADPQHAYDLFTSLRAEFPDVDPVAHFHDARGAGIANTLAAVSAGVRVVDSSLGGTGGEPSGVEQGHRGLTGNVASEDLVSILNRMGFATGVDLDTLLEAGRLAEELHERELYSAVQRSGPPSPRR